MRPGTRPEETEHLCYTLPMNPPLERDRSPVAAAPTACLCQPSPRRRLHSDPLRAGTSRAPDADGFQGARRDHSSGRFLRVTARTQFPVADYG